jgi:hypothetical protein
MPAENTTGYGGSYQVRFVAYNRM